MILENNKQNIVYKRYLRHCYIVITVIFIKGNIFIYKRIVLFSTY